MKFTPELIFMIIPALILDLCGAIIVIFALDDLGILDILGMLIFFPWLMLKGKGTPELPDRQPKKFDKIKKLFKSPKTRIATPLVGEVLPWVGGIGFFWTMSVIANSQD